MESSDKVQTADILVIGGGIAGASAAALLAEDADVILLERESVCGYHTTGRSASLFSETYGNHAIRLLTRASRAFFESQADGMTEYPILTPRGMLHVAMPGQMPGLETMWTEVAALDASTRRLDADSAFELVPVLRPDQVEGAVYEPMAMDMDVHALQQAYLRLFAQRSGRTIFDAEVKAVRHKESLWTVETAAGVFMAPLVVNAAGAWADEIGALAGLPPIGLVPKRRTVLLVPAPDNVRIEHCPLTIDIGESIYFKADAGKLLVSPADETPNPPCDVQPDELDVAFAVDRLEKLTSISVRRIEHKWAGLRSFVADKTPVIGFDPFAAGFFWLAAQGGYGVQTADAMARSVVKLIQENRLPDDLERRGLEAATLSPARLHRTS